MTAFTLFKVILQYQYRTIYWIQHVLWTQSENTQFALVGIVGKVVCNVNGASEQTQRAQISIVNVCADNLSQFTGPTCWICRNAPFTHPPDVCCRGAKNFCFSSGTVFYRVKIVFFRKIGIFNYSLISI